jgi:hypothetical protein
MQNSQHTVPAAVTTLNDLPTYAWISAQWKMTWVHCTHRLLLGAQCTHRLLFSALMYTNPFGFGTLVLPLCRTRPSYLSTVLTKSAIYGAVVPPFPSHAPQISLLILQPFYVLHTMKVFLKYVYSLCQICTLCCLQIYALA